MTRATKAVLAAGLPVARVEINKDGVIVVVPVKAETAEQRQLENVPLVTDT